MRAGARAVRREVPGQAQGRRVLRAQDRHPDRGRPRPRVADGDDPGRPADAARAVRPLLHRRGGPASSGRSRSTARSTARSSGSSASSIEHFAGAFPLWCAPVQAVVIPIADRHIEAAERAGRRPRGRAACGSRSTSRRTGCRTRSGSPRSRRCRTWSSSATARSRPGRPRRGRAPASSSRPSAGTSFADRLAAEAASGASDRASSR